MAQNDLLKRYLDAGLAFTAMTQARAEAIVKNLVTAGELQREQAQSAVEELVERSRSNTEKLLDSVRREVRSQLSARGLATKGDISRLEHRIDAISKKVASPSATAKPKPTKKSAAKKSAAKKRPAKKRSATRK